MPVAEIASWLTLSVKAAESLLGRHVRHFGMLWVQWVASMESLA